MAERGVQVPYTSGIKTQRIIGQVLSCHDFHCHPKLTTLFYTPNFKSFHLAIFLQLLSVALPTIQRSTLTQAQTTYVHFFFVCLTFFFNTLITFANGFVDVLFPKTRHHSLN
jgi:hypothetical protein